MTCPVCRAPLAFNSDNPLAVCWRLRDLLERQFPEQISKRRQARSEEVNSGPHSKLQANLLRLSGWDATGPSPHEPRALQRSSSCCLLQAASPAAAAQGPGSAAAVRSAPPVWQHPARDQDLRRHCAALLLSMLGPLPVAGSAGGIEWRRQYVRRLEVLVYCAAASREEYADWWTLHARALHVMPAMDVAWGGGAEAPQRRPLQRSETV